MKLVWFILLAFGRLQCFGATNEIARIIPAGTVAENSAESVPVLTPKPPLAPRINGPKIFGVRPGSPFLFRIPATGKRPLVFAAENLPAGLSLNAKSGIITGSLKEHGKFAVTLIASNALGVANGVELIRVQTAP